MSDSLARRFTEAFDHRLWNDPESFSGPGSTLSYTEELRSTLPALVRALGCESLLDAPCGDFNWMKAVDLDGIEYTGTDIVPTMIDMLAAKYPRHRFLVQDITKDPFPQVDFVLCRDVLFHLSNADILAVLRNFLASGSSWLATTHFFQVVRNEDVVSDPKTFRWINLMAPPFHLPPPDFILSDTAPLYARRWLGVWNRSWIAEALGG
jgi:SAM-dependent methyltransferase